MKPLLLLLALSILGCKSHKSTDNTKYFTGSVEYQYSYESNKVNTDSLRRTKPFKSFFRYDTNDYQSQFIGKDTYTYFYSGKLNKCISETNSKKDYECEDYSSLTDSIISFKVYDTDEKILGHRCKIVEYQTKYFWNRYYVSRDLKISPHTYQKHLAYNWSFYGDKANGGLILKLEHRFKNYTMKGIAVGIKEFDKTFKGNEISEKLFEEICAKTSR
ncbi:MAG: hypothetical protein V4666_07700 [Bacteroidota bacterium]